MSAADSHGASGNDADLALALELAEAADVIALGRFRATDLVVETKPDLTPVTEADRAIEEMLRDRLATARPEAAVIGEEFGKSGDASARWILDPIDGTKNFVRGVPVWATLIALERDGAMTVGVVSAPALGRRWWASQGGGAFANGEPIRVSAITDLADAHLAYDSVTDFEALGLGEEFLALSRRCWRSRGFGDFWAHMFVAEGAVDVAVETEVFVWDFAAVQLVVEEAGGRATQLGGVPLADGGSIVTTNGVLHDRVVAALQGGAHE